MQLNIKLLFLFLIIFGCQLSYAQVIPPKKDSLEVYRDIEKYSKKRKFTKFVHKLFFRPIGKQKVKKNSFQKLKKVNFSKYEGKIIREINITTLDPFGYSVLDTTNKPKTFIEKSSNFLHIKTKKFAIRNILLIKKNQPLDSLLIKESERLLRKNRFIRNFYFQYKLVSKDSVDVSIRALDSWTLVPDFTTSISKSNFYLTDKNFFGTGHEFSNSYINGLSKDQKGFRTKYTVPNIMNTYIKSVFSYDIDIKGNYTKYINIERPFYSPYTRWASGIYFDQHYGKVSEVVNKQVIDTSNYKYNSQDYWFGKSFQIFKGNTEYNRATNFIINARYFNKIFTEKPQFSQDSLGIYSNEKLYLIGFGISSRKYTEDKYLFNFNVSEDVSSGFVYSLTTGFQNKNAINKFYIGSKVAMGSYFGFGYLSGNLEYGTFFNEKKSNQSTLILNLIYFTNLIETGKWKFRQFIKPELIIGNNRLDSFTDKLTLNGDAGIQGFNNETILGTKKLLVSFQTQGYSPWRVYGFRLNPYFNYTMGMLGQKDIGFSRSKVYSQFGLGIIISNDYLVFSSFQFSFSLYPFLPDQGNLILKTNVFRTADFNLQDFEISKPMLVPYR